MGRSGSTKNQDLPLRDVVASRFLLQQIAMMEMKRLLPKKDSSVVGSAIGVWTSTRSLRFNLTAHATGEVAWTSGEELEFPTRMGAMFPPDARGVQHRRERTV